MNIGASAGTFRLLAQSARTEVQFARSAIRGTSVIVPVGTRVAAGSNFVFRTVQELIIPAGDSSGRVDAIVTGPGA